MRGLNRAMSAAVIGLLAFAAPAAAETLKVTRHDDPPPGKCKLHDCSLREALKAANSDFDRDVVVLGRGTYEMQIPAVPGDLGQQNGDFEIYHPVTVRGKGPTKTKIDANGLDRVFVFNDQSTPFKVSTLRSLTVKGGDAGAVADVQHPSTGGGIFAVGKAALEHVTVSHNTAEFGGGIRSQAASFTITHSTIAKNTAIEGGGLNLPSALFQGPATEIRSSTISDNSASKGGGILADGYHPGSLIPPVVSMVTSTVAGNTTSAEGGGIMADNDASVTLGGSTVAYNSADSDNTGGGVGGGIHQHSGAAFVFADSILAGNTVGSSGTDPQCNGSFTSNSGAVTEVQSNLCAFTGSPAQVGGALIGPLAPNGGPTKTVALLTGSPAIGRSVECAKRDQRGVLRPADGCDSGAYERAGP